MIMGGPKMYRAEILGRVPNGLTHNDVFATVKSVLEERVRVESISKRRLSGNMVSIIAKFSGEFSSESSASAEVMYAATSVSGFAADVMIRETR